ncbi:MAG: helix-turn-helix domain-containing protein [Clostridia bacterium]|nr:helix-turn-helix domain-containing protein [Clostridia bacterium]
MSDYINENKELYFHLHSKAEQPYIAKIGKAFSSPDRLRILDFISSTPANIQEISKQLNIPLSTVSSHVEVLSDAQLILTAYQPGLKGHMKVCYRVANLVSVNFNTPAPKKKEERSFEIPVGHFSEIDVTAPCGMIDGKARWIGKIDSPKHLYLPERVNAELLWFNEGFITYLVPNLDKHIGYSEISLSMEVCSEAVYYRDVWPSDITIFLNDVEIATFTSPGDFGGKRGKYTPTEWSLESTQFGILKTFTINESGVFIDFAPYSDKITIKDLQLETRNCISLKIGIKADAVHKGGVNLFGKNFGNHPQAIVITTK